MKTLLQKILKGHSDGERVSDLLHMYPLHIGTVVLASLICTLFALDT